MLLYQDECGNISHINSYKCKKTMSENKNVDWSYIEERMRKKEEAQKGAADLSGESQQERAAIKKYYAGSQESNEREKAALARMSEARKELEKIYTEAEKQRRAQETERQLRTQKTFEEGQQ